MTDLRSLSIQYENKINGLYALFVALERVNMRYMEKMKSRNSNPQTAKQLKTRLKICKKMEEVVKNTKKYEDVLTDKEKNLLPKSCNINPLKPRSENLTKLTNPYFEKPPIKKAPIPNLLTKCRSTLEIKKDQFPEMSSSSQTTAAFQSPNESKTLHPWCKLTRTDEEFKNNSTKKTAAENTDVKDASETKKKMEHNITSMKNEVTTENTDAKSSIETKEKIEHNITSLTRKTDVFNIPSMKNEVFTGKTDVNDASETRRKRKHKVTSMKNEVTTEKTDVKGASDTKKKEEHNITTMKNEQSTEDTDVNNGSDNESSLYTTNPRIKYTTRKMNMFSEIPKKRILSLAEEDEVYPWRKESAKNRLRESPLSKKIQKITGANKLLQPVMKSELFQNIEFPEHICKTIINKIEKQGDNYVCTHCDKKPPYSSKRRNMVTRHVITELGYYKFRCSFCDEMSNHVSSIIVHYATTHGIPTNWLQSN